jgi:hypothetical protein
VSQEAVDLWRELAAGNRDAYLHALATSLWNLGYVAVTLNEVTDDIIRSTEEGVRYFTELAASEPTSFSDRRDAAAATLATLQQKRAHADAAIKTDPTASDGAINAT